MCNACPLVSALQDSALSASPGGRLLLSMKYIYTAMRKAPSSTGQPTHSPVIQVHILDCHVSCCPHLDHLDE